MFFSKRRIYLDTAAATPMDNQVARLLCQLNKKFFGNAGSLHSFGTEANKWLAMARQDVAKFLDVHSDEIIFTSGGTEANNLAIFGLAREMLRSGTLSRPGHIITCAIEHLSVLEPIRALEREGWATTVLPVDESGAVKPEDVLSALRSDTVLVSIMMANNELGTIQPIREISKVLRSWRKENKSILPYLHTDACQTTRFFDLRVPALGVDMLTINGAKVYGPKGVGALYVRRGINLLPIIYGGGQESGRRSGTENVVMCAAFAKSLEIATRKRLAESLRLESLRDYLISQLKINFPLAAINGEGDKLPDIVNFSVPDLSGEQVVIELDARGIAVSTGSACEAQDRDLSYVVEAVTGSKARAEGAVRVSLARETKKSDINYLIKSLKGIITKYQKYV